MSELERKQREAAEAKARLAQSLGALKHSVEPEAIADSVGESAKDYMRRTADQLVRNARQSPKATAGLGVAAALLLFRKPIFKALFSRRRKKGDDHG